MNVFEAVKQSVTTRQSASFYGIRVGRNGMVCCPFHNDRTPSMKVDSRFYYSDRLCRFAAWIGETGSCGQACGGLRRFL